MYSNNQNTPNWNSPLLGGSPSNMNPTLQQIPPSYSYPYPTGTAMVNPQQMAQYGPSNIPYPQNNQNGSNFAQNTIRGRVIGDISQVTPSEVPMDGTVSLFATSDYSKIYAKQWAADGTIKTVEYVPAISTEATVQQQSPVDLLRNEIMGKFDEVFAAIAGIGAQTTPKKTTNARKEVSPNE